MVDWNIDRAADKFMQIGTANAAPCHLNLDLPGRGNRRLTYLLDAHVFTTVPDRCFHSSSPILMSLRSGLLTRR